MPGLVPGIHACLFLETKQGVDGRDKPGHDGRWRRATLTGIASAFAKASADSYKSSGALA